jgi:hypothetical protein
MIFTATPGRGICLPPNAQINRLAKSKPSAAFGESVLNAGLGGNGSISTGLRSALRPTAIQRQ